MPKKRGRSQRRSERVSKRKVIESMLYEGFTDKEIKKETGCDSRYFGIIKSKYGPYSLEDLKKRGEKVKEKVC